MKRKKGPDQNLIEVFVDADEKTREIYREVLNKLTESQNIPGEWQEGEILRMYKGKCKKGKWPNETGITLSSNLGKLYERIMNERIKKKINMSDTQAGGRKHVTTEDHLLILKEMITHARNQKKDIHIAYRDVSKAYVNAWVDAIMYMLYKEYQKYNHWTIDRKLQQNLTATVNTMYGATRKEKKKNSIRQTGFLSVMQFGLLMDETNKKITKENQGKKYKH